MSRRAWMGMGILLAALGLTLEGVHIVLRDRAFVSYIGSR